MMRRGLALLSTLLISVGAAGAAEFYQSNELGMRIAPIEATQRGEHQWVLEVERDGSTEVRTLFDDGKITTRWEDGYQGTRLASESVFENGKLVSTTEFKNGRPEKQSEYSGGELTLVREYAYAGDLLKSVSVYDGNGALQYRDIYSEGTDGRLRRAVRESPDGKRSVASFTFSADRLIAEWLGSGGDGVLFRYSGGDLAAKEHWSGTDLQSTEEISATRNGSVSVTTDFSSGTATTKRFNEAGKILSEEVTKKGVTIRTAQYTYRDGKLSTKVTKSSGHREEVQYEYDNGGELSSSRTTVNRKLVKVTHYTGKDTYFEDLYLNGSIVLHVYYENGKKVKEVAASPAGAGGGPKGAGG